MTPADRDRFDTLLERVIEALPVGVASRLDEIPIVVEDHPSDALRRALIADGTIADDDEAADLCGLHTGVALTERSIEDAGVLPDQIHLFREGIVSLALDQDPGGSWQAAAEWAILEEIRITLLHEIGHHFGLDEEDLEGLGYA